MIVFINHANGFILSGAGMANRVFTIFHYRTDDGCNILILFWMPEGQHLTLLPMAGNP